MILRLVCVIFILNSIKSLNAKGLIEVFKWKQMDFYDRGSHLKTNSHSPETYFPGQCRGTSTKHLTDNNSSYIPESNVPTGVTHYEGRLFITVPRLRVGIPSTLNYIDLNADGHQESPKLRAYPDFATNQLTSNRPHLVSVFRTRVDKFGRLWFIDTGMLKYGRRNFTQIQRPTIWVIDLHTDSVKHRFEIPASIVAEGRGLESITVDTDLGPERTFAYIPDSFNSRLYVYSFESDRMWSFEHNYFHFDPTAGDFGIDRSSIGNNDGLFSISMGPKVNNGASLVFFHAMASNNEFGVLNTVLQNEANAIRSDHGRDFLLIRNRGEMKQSTMHEYDPRTRVVFYAEVEGYVGCWDPFKAKVGKVEDEMVVKYSSDLTIDQNGTLWIITQPLPLFLTTPLQIDDYNFVVWKQTTQQAVLDTIWEDQ